MICNKECWNYNQCKNKDSPNMNYCLKMIESICHYCNKEIKCKWKTNSVKNCTEFESK